MIRTAVVVSLPRAASTLMCEALAQHPSVLGFGEIFDHVESGRQYYHHKGSGEETGYFQDRPDDLPRYFAHLDYLAEARGKAMLTWKLMDYQEPLCWQLLENNPNIPLIYTRRENLLDAVASSETCLKTGAWHAHTPGDIRRANAMDIHLDPALLDDLFNRRNALEAKLREISNPVFTMDYDAFTSRFVHMTKLAYSFLGLPLFEPVMTQTRLHRRSVKERVRNYNVLKARYADTPLGLYFSE